MVLCAYKIKQENAKGVKAATKLLKVYLNKNNTLNPDTQLIGTFYKDTAFTTAGAVFDEAFHQYAQSQADQEDSDAYAYREELLQFLHTWDNFPHILTAENWNPDTEEEQEQKETNKNNRAERENNAQDFEFFKKDVTQHLNDAFSAKDLYSNVDGFLRTIFTYITEEVRGCLKSKGYGKSIGKFFSEGAYRDGIPERLAG